ncbi:MAG: sulfotransferase [Dokdonella sp.]
MLQDAFNALQSGDAARAEALSRNYLTTAPNDEGGLLVLAMSLDAQSRTIEALAQFDRLAALFPTTPAHWTNLGNARRTMGYNSGAREAYERALSLDPDEPATIQGFGELCLQLGEFQPARKYLLRAHELNPGDANLRGEAAKACYECGDGETAELVLQGWQQWASHDPLALGDIAWTFARIGDDAQAESALEIGDRLAPGNPRIMARRAALYERSNRIDEARALLERIDDRAAKSDDLREEIAIVRALLAARGGDLDAACRMHEEILADPAAQRRHLYLQFSLARLYDRKGDSEAAMVWLRRGHDMLKLQLKAHDPELFSPDSDPLETQRLRISQVDFSGWQTVSPPSKEESPIFVVGFPRSGTTMLETMLDAHPQLAGMDERSFLQDVVKSMRGLGMKYPDDIDQLDDETCQQLRATYWHLVRTRARIDPGKRLVDKNPLNMFRLALIKRLFPESPIILALRHPCDVVLSNYMQLFHAPAYAAMCTNIESTARGYASAFEYWLEQAALLQPKIMELRYEDIVDDIDAQSRKIAEFLDIPWDARMVSFQDRALARGFIATPSYHQVVEPINRKGIDRWLRYRGEFETALPHLKPYLERWGYTS